jgi:hypothetical protein
MADLSIDVAVEIQLADAAELARFNTFMGSRLDLSPAAGWTRTDDGLTVVLSRTNAGEKAF